MARQRTGGTAKFRATVTILGIWILGAMVLWSSGCNRTEYGQFSSHGEGLFWAGVRPASGDSARLLRNAHYLKLMGRQEMALKELEAARQQDPHNLRVLDTLARTYEERGDFIQAQKIYQEALALDGSNQALNNNLCFSYYLTGQWEKAESCFRQALAKNPQNITVRNNLGLLLCRRGRQEEARRLWQEAEGEIAAQKKMQQVMVALGLGEPAHYAQRPQPAPAPAASTPVKKPLTTAKAPVPAASPPPPPKSAATAAKARKLEKLATKPVPAAVRPDKKPAPPATARKPAPQPDRELTVAAKAGSAPAAPKAQAKSAPVAVPAKPAPQVLAAAQPQTTPQPAPPKQAAGPEKKPVPATTPPPSSKQLKPRLARASGPAPVTVEKPEKTAKFAKPGIELLNGSGAKHMARKTRTRLSGEGFKVVSIGNYRDLGADQTVIYYRPGAEDAARDLSAKFFPNSRLETGKKFARNADIKVLLGKDLLAPPAVAREPAPLAEKIAAGTAPSQTELKPAAASTAASASAAAAQTPASPSLPAPAAAEANPEAQDSTDRPYLTAAELGNTAIDIRNGSGAKNMAHKARSMLSQEGFYVAHIGNHWDFGAEKTVIYYRPDAEKVARNLGDRFFPHSQLEQSAKLPKGVAVKVLLGKDLLQRDDLMANLSN